MPIRNGKCVFSGFLNRPLAFEPYCQTRSEWICRCHDAPQGGSSTVTFSISGLPSRTSATFSPTFVTSGSGSTLSISTNSTGPKGTFVVTVTGKNGSFTHSTPLTLTIN